MLGIKMSAYIEMRQREIIQVIVLIAITVYTSFVINVMTAMRKFVKLAFYIDYDKLITSNHSDVKFIFNYTEYPLNNVKSKFNLE